MKITAHRDHPARGAPNLLWLAGPYRRGLIGLGETFFLPRHGRGLCARICRAAASSAAIRSQIDRLATDLVGYVGFRSTGAEVRGNSAFDIALWDLFGKATGQPIAQLLGGFSPPRDPHLQHLRRHRLHADGQGPEHRQLRDSARSSDYDDLDAFLQPRRRARRGPARGGHHGHEDLAVRHRRREDATGSTSRRPI